MATEPEQPPVDESPISPISPIERRNSLEKHLQHRPDPQDLKNRHILLDTNAAPYVFPATTSTFFLNRTCAYRVVEADIDLVRLVSKSTPVHGSGFGASTRDGQSEEGIGEEAGARGVGGKYV